MNTGAVDAVIPIRISVIDSSQPFAVIVNDVDVTGAVEMATYGGIRMPAE